MTCSRALLPDGQAELLQRDVAYPGPGPGPVRNPERRNRRPMMPGVHDWRAGRHGDA